jgi:aspartate racemase
LSLPAVSVEACRRTFRRFQERRLFPEPQPLTRRDGLLHVLHATGERIRAAGHRRVGLLGTRFTMEESFYRSRLTDFGIESLVPDAPDREVVHRVIYEELCQGEIREDSRGEYVRIIRRMGEQGAEAVILGCTEIGMLIRPEDSPLPAFDTTRIHAEAAVEWALPPGKE